MLTTILAALATDRGLQIIGTILGVAIVAGWRAWRKDKADGDLAIFERGTRFAYQVVNEVAAMTPTKVDDKAAYGLSVLADYLATHGRQLTPELEAEARLRFQAMHGEEKAQAKIAAEAAAAKQLKGVSLATELAAIGKGS